ncbi:TPA: Tat pathway signal protein, partial [Candidatus Bathyarchaeota archaeon]|nr:Tat pathway signal protein [Candidatus Bathyarchaeota archaeon]
MIWGYLIHLSYNMWADREVPGRPEYLCAKPYLRFDENLWNDLLKRMAEVGVNMIVIDLGDGVKYDSHPEIAVENAWPVNKLKEEIKKIRELGLEPIPKLNFSTCHDAWLGPYSRCVSTETYYDVCRDLIDEVITIFNKPRFFHLGMDEETAQHQRNYEYVVIRQFDLWWQDLLFLVREVEKRGVRSWIWSDYVWRHPEEFFKRMPKSVLQSNWYYGAEFNEKIDYVKAYLDLDAHGYDQIPTGSNWSVAENFEKTVQFCLTRLSKDHLLGFLQTVWKPTMEP